MICNVDAKTLLAYVAAAYLIASIFYMIGARYVGSPWKEAMKRIPEELLAIRAQSVETRRNLFLGSLGAAILTLLLWRPFQENVSKE